MQKIYILSGHLSDYCIERLKPGISHVGTESYDTLLVSGNLVFVWEKSVKNCFMICQRELICPKECGKRFRRIIGDIFQNPRFIGTTLGHHRTEYHTGTEFGLCLFHVCNRLLCRRYGFGIVAKAFEKRRNPLGRDNFLF